jgi:hypothetical protein
MIISQYTTPTVSKHTIVSLPVQDNVCRCVQSSYPVSRKSKWREQRSARCQVEGGQLNRWELKSKRCWDLLPHNCMEFEWSPWASHIMLLLNCTTKLNLRADIQIMFYWEPAMMKAPSVTLLTADNVQSRYLKCFNIGGCWAFKWNSDIYLVCCDSYPNNFWIL